MHTIPNNFELCQGICKLSDSILGAALIENGILVAMNSKHDIPVPIPSEERFRAIFFQTEFMARIHRSNEDFYGDLQFFTAHFKHGDVFSFPLDKYGYARKAILAFKIIPPYSYDELIESILEYFRQAFGAPKS